MNPLSFLIISAVVVGSLFLGAALVIQLRSVDDIPKKIVVKWQLISVLMGSFLIGYLLFLAIQIFHADFPLEVLTSAVFFGGGLFVFVITRITLHSLSQIAENERQLKKINLELEQSNLELTKAYDTTIEGWGHALELRDRETEGHSKRVVRMTVDICIEFGMTEEELVHVTRGALLHDIGKMAVPDTVLLKEGELTGEELAQMHKHPLYAYEMLSKIEYLKPALDIPYCHHERWDGTGYPRGLKGKEIPLAARIFSLVDTWDALVSERRYHEPWSKEKARKHIRSRSGTHFDPEVVDVFLQMDCCH
ncbi:MAG: HD domain-containing protein [Proteobacteria bacterium]|nr:HD domain-containing protein [Pseudomonadota bacterium]MBU1738512.1 HD domain-containing protein [Pseudomonadota bacterium]